MLLEDINYMSQVEMKSTFHLLSVHLVRASSSPIPPNTAPGLMDSILKKLLVPFTKLELFITFEKFAYFCAMLPLLGITSHTEFSQGNQLYEILVFLNVCYW